MPQPAEIPGQIERLEQTTLTRLAADVRGGAIVEFGSFFGRSTACLVEGVQTWWAPGDGPTVFAFDSFSCAEDGLFAPSVHRAAERGGVAQLLRREQGAIDFRPVFDHYLHEAEQRGVLRTTTTELRDAAHDGRPIALMHIDAPKVYEELKYILFRFFPSLTAGSRVVFQDYFYHWSGSLIAAVQLAVERGVLKHEESAASSLVSKVLRTPTPADLMEIDLGMNAPLAPILGRSLRAIEGLPLDRPAQFAPRVRLAAAQLLWSLGDHAAAQGEIMAVINSAGGNLPAPVVNDLMELLHYGFSTRELYKADRK